MSELNQQSNTYDDVGSNDVLTELPRDAYHDVKFCAAHSPKFQSDSRCGSNLDYDAEDDTIFALDEDAVSRHLDGSKNKNSLEERWEDSSDEDGLNSTKMERANFASPKILSKKQHAVPSRSARHPSASLAISLPVNITNGIYSRNDSLPDDEDELEDDEEEQPDSVERGNGRPRAQTILSTREDRMYRNMQAYSRSIQPADDPERLFGERPHRRYRPTEQSGDGSNNSNDRFAVPSVSAYRCSGGSNVGSARLRGGCSLAAMPMAPIIANDLNLISAGGGASNNTAVHTNTNSGSVARPRVPSSFSGNFC